jgi:hypothetical protein
MAKTQYQRRDDNNWKRMLASEQKKNSLHKAKNGLNKSLNEDEKKDKDGIIWRTIYLNKKPR